MSEIIGLVSLMAFGITSFALGYVIGSRDRASANTKGPTIKHLTVSVLAHIDTERHAMDIYDARWEIKP